MTSWNFWIHTYHHLFLSQWPDLQAEIRHSHGQPCFSTSGQHVHGAFRTETPRHSSRRFETKIMEKVCGRHSRDCKEKLSGKTHRVSKWTGWLSQHTVHIRSGTRWPVTISRFVVKQDRKWWLEATDLQETPTLISIWTSALTTPLNINWVWWERCWKEVSASLQRVKIGNRKISM